MKIKSRKASIVFQENIIIVDLFVIHYSNTLSTKAKVMKIVIDSLMNDDIDRHK